MMSSCILLVPYCRLYMRPLQEALTAQWIQSEGSFDDVVQVTPKMVTALQWWTRPGNLSQGLPFLLQASPQVITTDASLEGWGGFLQELRITGKWSPPERKLHINLLELRAVYLALLAFLPRIKDSLVLVRTDNTTTMHYLNKQGGTRSLPLSRESQKIWNWHLRHNISLRAEYVLGMDYVLADSLSRQKTTCHEWELNQRTLDRIFFQWGTPVLDLFATRENAKCQNFASWHLQRGSLGNAFSIAWFNIFAYAFPPIPLIPRVLRKLKAEPCTLILIAPAWPRQRWFTELHLLSLQPPTPLKLFPSLLTMNRKQVQHPDPASLKLSAWLLSSESSMA